MDRNNASQLRVHLLDMDGDQYGDCILCEYGPTTVLVDGGHAQDIASHDGCPSVPDQLQEILGGERPLKVSLLVVTHCHSDHIGCLPEMIEQGIIEPEWALVIDEHLGFGHASGDEAGGLDAPGVSPAVRRVVAGLREENHDDLRDAALQDFLDAAANVEPGYRRMLETLEQKLGPKLVRYRGEQPVTVEDAFQKIGLKILGPSQDQMLLCAEAIHQMTKHAIDAVGQLSEGAGAGDAAGLTDTALYRSLAGSPLTDATDSRSSGAPFNDHSIVLTLTAGGGKVLLTGDMQFTQPELPDLTEEMKKLRAAVAAEAPFDFVKLAHHASTNGFNEDLFKEWKGSVRLGISGGSRDAKHPSPVVLTTLKRLRKKDDSVTWARTDRNGHITVTFGPQGELIPQRGQLNSGTPNSGDEPLPAAPSLAAATPGTPASPGGAGSPAPQPGGGLAPPPAPSVSLPADQARLSATFPYHGTQVTFRVDLEPLDGGGIVKDQLPGTSPTDRLAGGRDLPRLLFVTSREALRRNLGQREADTALKLITDAGRPLLDSLPDGATNPNQVLDQVRSRLTPDIRGVVIVGGYDVVPAHRLDALDAKLRAAVQSRDGDPGDNYMVWSDAIYGDRDGDGMSELAVSRIPDAKTPALVMRLLASGRGSSPGAGGVRNKYRPYAATIYRGLSGANPSHLLVSEPTGPKDPQLANGVLTAPAVYLMLHGDYVDAARFWGETTEQCVEAINVGNILAAPNSVVFCGACWGALTVAQRAVDVADGTLPAPRPVGASMALSFLNAGALAFVGCTGSHYSLEGSDVTYYGAPMHQTFWKYFAAGSSPAEALFQAKTAYIGGIPHRNTGDPVDTARELKILRQFTCLGLGW